MPISLPLRPARWSPAWPISSSITPGWDAGILKPGRERVPQVVRTAEPQIVECMVERWLERRPARRIGVIVALDQSRGLELAERGMNGPHGRQAAA